MILITYLRTFRIGPFAIFDFAASYLLVYLLAPFLQKLGLKLSREQILWLTLPVSILVHLVFQTHTPLTKMFLDPYGSYWVKALVAFMLVMAFRKHIKQLFKRF